MQVFLQEMVEVVINKPAKLIMNEFSMNKFAECTQDVWAKVRVSEVHRRQMPRSSRISVPEAMVQG